MLIINCSNTLTPGSAGQRRSMRLADTGSQAGVCGTHWLEGGRVPAGQGAALSSVATAGPGCLADEA